MFVAKTYIFNISYFIKFLCIAINFINIIASRLEEPAYLITLHSPWTIEQRKNNT